MWCNNDNSVMRRGFFTPPETWRSQHSPVVVGVPMSERKRVVSSPGCKRDLFHIIHKVPAGDSPYVRAKHVQLIEKDPSKAISLFWAAINAGDRVDSALKDMAAVMKQLNRSDEAIEAIKSFRHLCGYDTQESLDNVLVELYKRSGRTEEEIEMLQQKLKSIEEGIVFGGKRTKTARSQGKKIQVTAEQERSRILGNLAWAYLQQHNYGLAEQHYRKALSLEPDTNKQCNLAICLMHMKRISEAKSLLLEVKASCGSTPMNESFAKSFERAFQMLTVLEPHAVVQPTELDEDTQRSLDLPSTRILEEGIIPTNGDGSYVSEFKDSKRCTDGHNEETVLPSEQSTEPYCRNHYMNEGNFLEYDKKSLKFTASGLRGSQSCKQAAAGNSQWKDCHYESPYERSGFTTKMKENWISSAGTTLGSAEKTFSSPAAVLYTQPRRGPWVFNKGDQRRPGCGVDTTEQPSDELLKHNFRNLNRDLLDSGDENLELKSQCNLSSPTGGDCGRMLWREATKGKDATALEPWSRAEEKGDRRTTSWVGDQGGPAVEESKIGAKFPIEQIKDVDSARVSESVSNGELHHSTGVYVSGNINPTDSNGDESLGRKTSTKSLHKSWADMAEEEEEELLTRKDVSPCFDGWKCINDENLDSNIVHEISDPKWPVESLRKKIEAVDFRDWSATPENVVSSRNPGVRRSLCFEPGEDSNIKRRNRLQVFREITPSPDSP